MVAIMLVQQRSLGVTNVKIAEKEQDKLKQYVTNSP